MYNIDEEEKKRLAKQKQTVTKTTNTQEAPEVVPVEYNPDDTPFEYKEGMSVHDILERGRVKKQSLEDQEKRMQRLAKVAAVGDLFTALGGLAGGGYATPTQYKPSPYLTRAFSEIDRLRSSRERSDEYYDNLASKTRQDDYNNQLKLHLQNKETRDKYGYQSAKAKADAQNRANLEAYKSSSERVTDTYEDPTKWKQEQSLRSRQIDVQETNAESNRIRAERTTKGKEDPIILTINNGSKSSTITQSQAEKLVKRAKVELKDLIELPVSEEDKELAIALANSEIDKQSLAAAVSLLRKYNPGDYGKYFDSKESSTTGPQPKGTFLLKKKQPQPTKRYLLD